MAPCFSLRVENRACVLFFLYNGVGWGGMGVITSCIDCLTYLLLRCIITWCCHVCYADDGVGWVGWGGVIATLRYFQAFGAVQRGTRKLAIFDLGCFIFSIPLFFPWVNTLMYFTTPILSTVRTQTPRPQVSLMPPTMGNLLWKKKDFGSERICISPLDSGRKRTLVCWSQMLPWTDLRSQVDPEKPCGFTLEQ